VKEIEEAGGRAIAVTGDVTVEADVQRLTASTVDVFGRIDVLVNNAGAVVSRTSVGDCPDDGWDRTIEANLTSAFRCSRAMLPHLVRTKGCIVQIASVFSLLGAANSAAYTAAKGGLTSLTRAMAIDYGSVGVRVNAVCPAYIETDLNRELLAELRRTGRIGTVLDRLPLGQLGRPDDVAYAALYLASDEARWITGIALPVDGGMSAGRI